MIGAGRKVKPRLVSGDFPEQVQEGVAESRRDFREHARPIWKLKGGHCGWMEPPRSAVGAVWGLYFPLGKTHSLSWAPGCCGAPPANSVLRGNHAGLSAKGRSRGWNNCVLLVKSVSVRHCKDSALEENGNYRTLQGGSNDGNFPQNFKSQANSHKSGAGCTIDEIIFEIMRSLRHFQYIFLK